MLFNLVVGLLASVMALLGGQFLWRAGFRRQFLANPGYLGLSVAFAAYLIFVYSNPSMLLLWAFGGQAQVIFLGLLVAVIATIIWGAVGYVLNPGLVGRMYSGWQRRLDGFQVSMAEQAAADREYARTEQEAAEGKSSNREPSLFEYEDRQKSRGASTEV